jgi:hypothetical protein
MKLRALVPASAFLLAGCVTFNFDRDLRNAPISDEELAGLHPGEARLEQCLAELGAPLYVWEYKVDGMALAYGWNKEKTWNVTVSVPVTQYYSASASYTDAAANLRGAVLLFDRDLKLEMVRRGFLRSLRAEIGQERPAPVELEEKPPAGSERKPGSDAPPPKSD